MPLSALHQDVEKAKEATKDNTSSFMHSIFSTNFSYGVSKANTVATGTMKRFSQCWYIHTAKLAQASSICGHDIIIVLRLTDDLKVPSFSSSL